MREFSKLRKTDEKCSEIVSNFLDKHFYNVLTRKPVRYNTFEEQIKGIDIAFDMNDVNYICDEKAAIRYVNKPLSTFSMELSFIDRGGAVHDGWLLDEKKINNSFLFVWIDKAKRDIIEEEDDIEVLQIALVKRDKIIDYLSSLGWTSEKLTKKMDYIRGIPNEYMGTIKKNGCKFSYSSFLVEKPINVLISREKLIELSDFSKIFNK